VLQQLTIRNFVIIDELDLEFRTGMTVFTGETGAGKSILVGALGLLLGDRADSSVIRNGCGQAEITAIVSIRDNQQLADLLSIQEISITDDELYLRRVINTDGRSRAFINGTPVTAQLLRDIGENLVNIHGQHAHQLLTRRDIQRGLLDNYGTLDKQLAGVRKVWQTWHDTTRQLDAYSRGNTDQEAAMDLLRYQIMELENLQPEEDEYTELNEEYRRLANASRLLESARQAIAIFSEDEQSISSQLHGMLNELQELEQFDAALTGINQMLNEASIQISEACDELRNYSDHLDPDQGRLQEVEQRLSKLHDMARKHKVNPAGLAQHLKDLGQQLAAFENSQEQVNLLRRQQAEALQSYHHNTKILHQARCHAAAGMALEITTRMRELGMPDGQFEIAVNPADDQTPKPYGTDQVEFLVNINPGQSLQPLRKVASGGELSRISLAIQVIGSSDKGTPCLVFDEVDAGIGGGVAEITGALLHRLAEQRQVLCVTHLPQVAAQGDHHIQVQKLSGKSSTTTRIRDLAADERIDEIARMLGGVKITDKSRGHAREMLGKG
jgi:DNA repair protein RecN (Recombination protein N)